MRYVTPRGACAIRYKLFVALTRHFIVVIDWAANMPVIGLGLLASGLGL